MISQLIGQNEALAASLADSSTVIAELCQRRTALAEHIEVPVIPSSRFGRWTRASCDAGVGSVVRCRLCELGRRTFGFLDRDLDINPNAWV